MAARTPAYLFEGKIGPKRLIFARFTTANDGDTWATGLNTYVGSTPLFFATGIGNPSTQGSAGVHVEYSAGTLTFRSGEDSLGVDLMVVI